MREQLLSDNVFTRLVESVNALRDRAAARNDRQTLQDATQIRILVYRYFGTLVAEGKVSGVPENRAYV